MRVRSKGTRVPSFLMTCSLTGFLNTFVGGVTAAAMLANAATANGLPVLHRGRESMTAVFVVDVAKRASRMGDSGQWGEERPV